MVPLGPNPPRMMRKVVRHQARNEVIAVVIPRMAPQRQRVTSGGTDGLQQLRPQLLAQKLISLALVHQDGQALRSGGDQFHRIPLFPR